MKKEEVKKKLEAGELQFYNDSHNTELFCYLSNSNSNLFKYYYSQKEGCSFKPYNLPIINLSQVKL